MAKFQKISAAAASKIRRSKTHSKSQKEIAASSLNHSKIGNGKKKISATKFAKSVTASALTARSKSGRFIIGRKAFEQISAVEGVVLSTAMKADLRNLDKVSSEKRRQVLRSKYGKA
jgi:hypothetical protein